jgi:hypothetical protein
MNYLQNTSQLQALAGIQKQDKDRSPSLKLKRILNPMKFLYSPDKKSFYHGCRGISLD